MDHNPATVRAKFPSDSAALRSRTQCPYCFATAVDTATCSVCGINLHDQQLHQVLRLSLQAADLLDERSGILQRLHQQANRERLAAEAAVPPGAATPPEWLTPPAGLPVAAPVLPAQTPASQAGPDEPWELQELPAPPADGEALLLPAEPADAIGSGADWPLPTDSASVAAGLPEPTGVEVSAGQAASGVAPRHFSPQNLLLITGITFLAVAAVVFLTFAFVTYTLPIKALITATVTVGTLAGAEALQRRRLAASGEGLAVLGLILVGLDAWAVRTLNLLGLGAVIRAVYWGAALLVVAGGCYGWARRSQLRTPRLVAPALLPAGLVLFGIGLVGVGADLPSLTPTVAALVVAGVAWRVPATSASLAAPLLSVSAQLSTALLAVTAWGRVPADAVVFGPGLLLLGAAHWYLARVLAGRETEGTVQFDGRTVLSFTGVGLAALLWLSGWAWLARLPELPDWLGGVVLALPVSGLILPGSTVRRARGAAPAGAEPGWGVSEVGHLLLALGSAGFFLVGPLPGLVKLVDGRLAGLGAAHWGTIGYGLTLVGLAAALVAVDRWWGRPAPVWRGWFAYGLALGGLILAVYALPGLAARLTLLACALLALALGARARRSGGPAARVLASDIALAAAGLVLAVSAPFGSATGLVLAACLLLLAVWRISTAYGRRCPFGLVGAAAATLLVAIHVVAAQSAPSYWENLLAVAVSGFIVLAAYAPARLQTAHPQDRLALAAGGTVLTYLTALLGLRALPPSTGDVPALLATGGLALLGLLGLTLAARRQATRSSAGPALRALHLANVPAAALLTVSHAFDLVGLSDVWAHAPVPQADRLTLVAALAALVAAVVLVGVRRAPAPVLLLANCLTLALVAGSLLAFTVAATRPHLLGLHTASLLALVATLCLLGLTLLPALPVGAPTAWLAGIVAGWGGGQLLYTHVNEPWPLLLTLPTVLAGLIGAGALTTRAWSRTLPGSLTLAALTSGAFALLVGSALGSTGWRATPALTAAATLASVLAALVGSWVNVRGRALVTCLALSLTGSVLTSVSSARLLAVLELPAGVVAALLAGATAAAFAPLRRLPGASRPILELTLALVWAGAVLTTVPAVSHPVLAAGAACGLALVGLLTSRSQTLAAARPPRSTTPAAWGGLRTILPGLSLTLALGVTVGQWRSLTSPTGLLVGLLLLAAALLAVGLWRASGRDQLFLAATVPPAAWTALAVLPVGGRSLWWPLGLAGGLALVLGALAVRFRATRPPLLPVAAATTACLPALALALGQVREDHVGTALLLLAVVGNLVLFAGPRWAGKAVRGLRLVLVLLGLGGALLLTWQLPAATFPLLGVAAAGLLLALTLGLLADRGAPAAVRRDAPRYAAAAPLSCLALLTLSGRDVPVSWLLGIVVVGGLVVGAGLWRLGSADGAAQRSLSAGAAGTAVLTTLSGCGLLSVHQGADWNHATDPLELLLFPLTPRLAGGQALPWAAPAVTIPLALLFLVLAWQPHLGVRLRRGLAHRVLLGCCVVLLGTASAAHALGAIHPVGLRAAQLLVGLTLISLPALALADAHRVRLPRPGSPLPSPTHPAVAGGGEALAGPAPASAPGWARPNGASAAAGLPAPAVAAPESSAVPSGLERIWQQWPASLLLVGLAVGANLLVYGRLVSLQLTAPPETFLLPFGLVAVALGARFLHLDPQLRSWTPLSLGLVTVLVVPWLCEMAEPAGWRIALVTGAVVSAIVVGAWRRLQAPLLLGTFVGLGHAIFAVHTALPDLVVPWWVWLSIAGVILVTVATTYEARVRDARRLEQAVRALR
ncbi:SCO7613 C-terminal domain-containing membrane protein [Buchananella hordeovulneris]|uniref:SCO7613 C-terminal domain-containing membrane protein n=1 Tax=Buchananella hordeovulneris TaxID=52770 RepID=UPI0026DC6B0A|nr:hypothetical protein [Buchananella hordeovulneris]MDO5080540.1 hypothetical protein [Buchananella hordeovulneris]